MKESYYSRNKEKITQQRKLYYETNKDELKRRVFEYKKKHSDKIKYWRKGYLLRNKKHVSEKCKEYRNKNKDQYLKWRKENNQKLKEYRKQYLKDNIEVVRAYKRKATALRRARKLGAEGTYTDIDIQTLYVEQLGKCKMCKIAVLSKYHIDHIVPLCRGGSNWPSNLQILCPSCNCRKNTLTMDEFIEKNKR